MSTPEMKEKLQQALERTKKTLSSSRDEADKAAKALEGAKRDIRELTEFLNLPNATNESATHENIDDEDSEEPQLVSGFPSEQEPAKLLEKMVAMERVQRITSKKQHLLLSFRNQRRRIDTSRLLKSIRLWRLCNE